MRRSKEIIPMPKEIRRVQNCRAIIPTELKEIGIKFGNGTEANHIRKALMASLMKVIKARTENDTSGNVSFWIKLVK